MDWIRRVFNEGPDEDELTEEDSDDEHNLPEDVAETLNKRHDETEEDYEKARVIYVNAEDELKSSACSLDEVFFRSTNYLERLSRYETTIERRLRAAMQDLERLQAARKAEAAEAATVIDISDMNREEA